MTAPPRRRRWNSRKTYSSKLTVVPTNRTRSRLDLVDQVYKNEAPNWRAVAAETDWASPGPIGGAGGNHPAWRNQILLSALLPNRASPQTFFLLNAKPENVER